MKGTGYLWLLLSFWVLAPTCKQKEVPLPPIEPYSLDYLIKDSVLYDYFSVSEEGISLFESPEAKAQGIVETRIYPQEYPYLRRAFATQSMDSLLKWYEAKGTQKWSLDQLSFLRKAPDAFVPGTDSTLPLKGLRIAVDPGHTAGTLEEAEVESRYVKMRPTPDTQYDSILFWEANLTLGTGHLIRQKLEKLGATVLMTRTKPSKGVLGLTYEQWKRMEWEKVMAEEIEKGRLDTADLSFWREEATEKEIKQRFFTMQDLRSRARLINSFHPHLSLIIHYNIHGTTWKDRDEQGYFLPEESNYLMSFVPGGFMKGELATPEDRLQLVRMLLTEDVPRSIEVSNTFIQQSEALTGVPIVSPEEDLRYLQRSSILTSAPGVYARNLSLTRLIHGPMIYGESLCQDNLEEAITLNKKDLYIEGIWVSSRLEKVADAYVNAVLKFSKKKRN